MYRYIHRPPGPPKKNEPKRLFIAGSFAYGMPDDESDIDIIIFLDKETHEFLLIEGYKVLADIGQEGQYTKDSLMFGKINFLTCTTENQYEAWRLGTEIAIQESPITRERAIEIFSTLRIRFGVQPGVERYILQPRIGYNGVKNG